MNSQEEKILQEIMEYVKENNNMPTRRYLQKKFNYKSVNSITQYLKSLEKESYLKRNSEGKLILNSNTIIYNKSLKIIKVINMTNTYINIIIDKRKKYLGYKINNNYFNYCGILKNDILIIEIKKELKDNDIGLFIIDKKYRVMKYIYKEGFYLLEDNEKILLNKINIIGKVIMIERKL